MFSIITVKTPVLLSVFDDYICIGKSYPTSS